ncbi:extracellular solute-binding protein [Paenibacillus tuaregi]|uniref:extracellular solute-binding protein n=1 Tax=Paenibacillus tuaregi TaxID=1816681 RepID=UPI0008389F52|nr:extracellular solute-binding protein [Paenibacillus tuaregi]
MAKIDRHTFQNRTRHMSADLKQKINSGAYSPGEFLPSELALTEQYKLSKNSVRYVLDELVQEGLIIKIPRVGTQVTKPASKETIYFGVYPSLYKEAGMEELIKRFHEKHPHIHVETIELPYMNSDNIANLIKLGIIDALTINLQDMYQFQEKNYLDLFVDQDRDDTIYPFLTPYFEKESGVLTAQPFVYSPVILCYNKEHLREKRLGEPNSSWSWDELAALLRELKAPHRYSIAFQLFSMNRWPIFWLQNEDDPSSIDSSPAQNGTRLPSEGLRWLRDLVTEEGIFPLALAQGEFEAEKLFKEQKVSVMLTTYYMLNELKNANFSFDIAQLPHFKNDRTLLLSTAIALSAESSRKETAACFVNYLTSDEAQTYIRKYTYSLPASRYITETFSVELKNKPSRLELHRDYSSKYATYRDLSISMQTQIRFGESLKQYISYLTDEEGLAEVLLPSKSLNL